MVKLQEYVSSGGTLVSSYFTGFVNDTDLLHLGPWPEKLLQLLASILRNWIRCFPDEHQEILYEGKNTRRKIIVGLLKQSVLKPSGRMHLNFTQVVPQLRNTNLVRESRFIGSTNQRGFYGNFINQLWSNTSW